MPRPHIRMLPYKAMEYMNRPNYKSVIHSHAKSGWICRLP